MRIIIKILLFPIVLALTLLVAFCRFFCLFSGMVLGIFDTKKLTGRGILNGCRVHVLKVDQNKGEV